MPRLAQCAIGLLAFLLLVSTLPVQAIALPTDTIVSATTIQEGQENGVAFAANNSTVQHENPDTVESDSDTSALEQWLASRLSSQLAGSTVQIEQGEYDRAQSYLGDEYNDLLSKYVDVAGETDGEHDDETVESFKDAQQQQTEYVSHVQRYREIHDRYQEAKRNGNETKARQLARQLEHLQAEIDRTGANLTTKYDSIAENTSVNTGNETRTVRTVTQNISTQQRVIRESEFVTTNLTATADSNATSVQNPIFVTGRLTASNGTGLVNQTVRLMLGGNRTIETQTGANGTFTIVGRPAVVPLGNQSFQIAYLPANESVYLGANASIHTSVTQESATVTITDSTQAVRYNETVVVTGRVHAANVSVPDVPVAIYVDETRIGTTRTTANGTFSFTSSLPAGVPTGEQPVRVVFPFHDRALAVANATALATVGTTETNLALSGEANGTRHVDLSGQLHAADGQVLANQSVTISVNGSHLTTVQTDANGSFSTSLVLPSNLVASDGKTTFVAVFDGTDTNLESTRTSKVLAVTGNGSLDQTTKGWIASFGIATLITLSGFLLWRSGVLANLGLGTSGDMDAPVTDDVNTDVGDTQPGASSVAATRALLDHALVAFEDGEFETAVEIAYAAARERLATKADASAATHWEFYNACQTAELAPETLATLRDLTERYEQAAFTPTQMTREVATTVIDDVAGLLTDDRSTE